MAGQRLEHCLDLRGRRATKDRSLTNSVSAHRRQRQLGIEVYRRHLDNKCGHKEAVKLLVDTNVAKANGRTLMCPAFGCRQDVTGAAAMLSRYLIEQVKQFPGALRTRARVLGKTARHEQHQSGREIATQRVERWGRILHLRREERQSAKSLERRPAREHLVRDDAQRVDVGAIDRWRDQPAPVPEPCIAESPTGRRLP